MYLSRIIVPAGQAEKMGLADPYNCHRFVWSAFTEARRDHLFRIESDLFTGDLSILIMSKSEPKCPESVKKSHWGSKKLPDDFLGHDRYRFTLRCNPNSRNTSDRKRRAITDNDKLVEWINRQGEKHGFNVLNVVIENKISFQFMKKEIAGLIGGVDFSGVLEVSNKDMFTEAFECGIGAAKAFGFGMLQVIPIR